MQKASGARGREGGVQANCAGQLEVPVLGHVVVVVRRVTMTCGGCWRHLHGLVACEQGTSLAKGNL